jgi:hypothetical protein
MIYEVCMCIYDAMAHHWTPRSVVARGLEFDAACALADTRNEELHDKCISDIEYRVFVTPRKWRVA